GRDAAQIGAHHVGAAQSSAAQIGALEIGEDELGSVELGVQELRLAKIAAIALLALPQLRDLQRVASHPAAGVLAKIRSLDQLQPVAPVVAFGRERGPGQQEHPAEPHRAPYNLQSSFCQSDSSGWMSSTKP